MEDHVHNNEDTDTDLDENVDNDEVVPGVVEYALHHRAVVIAAVFYFFRKFPLVVDTEPGESE